MELDKNHYDRLTSPMQSHLNVGFSSDLNIADLANLIARTTGFKGKIHFDPSKPDGTPRKMMDSSKLRQLGWQPSVDLESGLTLTYANFLQKISS